MTRPGVWPEKLKAIRDSFRNAPWSVFLPQNRAALTVLNDFQVASLVRRNKDLRELPIGKLMRTPEYQSLVDFRRGGIPRGFNRPQVEFLKSESPERWLIASNRVGKSLVGALECAFYVHGVHPYREVPPAPNEVWAGFPDLKNHGKPITIPMLNWALGKVGVTFTRQDARYSVCSHVAERGVACPKCPNPSTVYLKSYDTGSKAFQGGAPAFIWSDEIPPQDVYDEISARIGVGAPLNMGFTLTPLKDAAWVYSDVYEEWLNEGCPPDQAFFEASIWQNPYLPLDEIDRIKRKWKHDPNQLAARLHGKWSMVSGRVYPMLDRSVHVVEDVQIPGVHRAPRGKEAVPSLYRCVDPGIRNPTAVLWVAVDAQGSCWVYREAYITDRSIKEVCADIDAVETEFEKKAGFVYTVIDPASSQRDLNDASRRIDTYAVHGLLCIPGNNQREAGFDAMKLAFSWEKDDEGSWRREPKYRFFASCPMVWREHLRYSWLPQPAAGSPRGPRDDAQKRDDHGVDALRYLEATFAGPKYVHPETEEVAGYKADDKTTGY